MKNFCFIIAFLLSAKYWSQITMINTGTTENIWQISESKGKIVINAAKNYIAKSYDTGDTFAPMNAPFSPQSSFLFQFQMMDSSLMYMISGYQNRYYLHKSINGANSWTKMLDTINPLTVLRFFDNNYGLIAGGVYELFRTLNGGNTLGAAPTMPFMTGLYMETYSDSILFFGGSTTSGIGDFAISKNRGVSFYGGGGFGSWNQARDFFCINRDTMFVIASDGIHTGLATSFDMGKSNFKYSALPISEGNKMYFKNKNEGYVIGGDANNKGIILKTSDLGKTWSTFNTQITTKLLDIMFLNDSIALVSGTGGVLFKWNSKKSVFTGISEKSNTEIGVNIYPNPITDKFQLQTANGSFLNLYLTINNNLGQTVFEKVVETNQDIDLSFLPGGVYYLKMKNEKGYRVFKIIKD